MPYALLERKIALISPQYQQELMDFVDFLLTRQQTPQTGLDAAIAELENGEYDTYSSFDDFMAEDELDILSLARVSSHTNIFDKNKK